jgi:hypothetical protein
MTLDAVSSNCASFQTTQLEGSRTEGTEETSPLPDVKSHEPQAARSQGVCQPIKDLLLSVKTAVEASFARCKPHSEKAPTTADGTDLSRVPISDEDIQSFVNLPATGEDEDDLESFEEFSPSGKGGIDSFTELSANDEDDIDSFTEIETEPSLQAADTQVHPPIHPSADAPAAPAPRAYDVVRMQQISFRGMAGLFSRGVCNAATMDWFRRIEAGLPTWKHVGGTPEDPLHQVEEVDWQGMRPRLQRIQAHGTSEDPLFEGYLYERVEPLSWSQLQPSHESRSSIASQLARDIIGNARNQFNQEPPPAHAFFQLDIALKGRLWGQVGHTTGIHIAQPQLGADLTVHFFDANSREAQIPEGQFEQWLAEHLESRYGSRLTSTIGVSIVQKQKLPAEDEVPSGL